MKEDDVRRRELADFLRTRRARLSPEMCGLRSGPRRRTGGLRREEIAELAGVSPSWYTKLEQGRDIGVSVRFLRNLVDALKLNSAEASQLFELALLEPSEHAAQNTGDVIPALQRMIDNMAISPAFILTARGDYLGSNDAADRLFGTYADNPSFERNLLVNLFLSQKVEHALPAWNDSADYQVSVFRSAFARNASNPSFIELVDRLMKESPEFRRIWEKHEVQSQTTRTLVFEHPMVGTLKLDYLTFYADMNTNLRIDIYTPLDELESKRKITQLLGARKSARR